MSGPILAATAATDPEVWNFLLQLLLLLTGALLIGMLFERFRQSAILGYLIAGMALGPNGFALVSGESGVPVIAELGVSLLLFAIGLEFSAKRLLRLGSVAGVGGLVQVIVTLLLAAAVGLVLGLPGKGALAIGAAVALSSTACVLRLLTDRGEIESVHGRTALGMLLLQDIAVVPLVLFVTMLAGEGDLADMALGLAKAVGLIVALVAGFRLLARYVIPRVMEQLSLSRDRELLVLLAVVLAIGSALAAHQLELSPALGAFLAGIMLAESPFATQIRADIGGLRILFVTLFFASVGMLGDPHWIITHAPSVSAVALLILGGKTLVVTAVALAFRLPLRYAFATGVALAQVGEFGVVIAGIAQSGQLLDDGSFRLLVSGTLVSLFATPLLIRIAVPAGAALEWLVLRRRLGQTEEREDPDKTKPLVMVIGFGPAGHQVATMLREQGRARCLVVDLRPGRIDLAESLGFRTALGDANSLEFLIHHGLENAAAVVITVPNHRDVVRIVGAIRTLQNEIAIVARARYHDFADEIAGAGANVLVDEEELTGRRLAIAVRGILREPS